MKKSLTIIFTLFFLLTLLSGCQSTTSGHEPESTEAFEETVEQSGEVVNTTEAEPFYGEVPAEKAKRTLLTIPAGWGDGQILYGYYNLKSFAAEDGVICILDTGKNRVIVYQNGEFSEIKIGSSYTMASYVRYRDGKVAVIDNIQSVVEIFSLSGESIARNPNTGALHGYPEDVIEIGDTYVIWRTANGEFIRRDWEKGQIETLERGERSVMYTVEADSAGGTVKLERTLGEERSVFATFDMAEWKMIPEEYFYFSEGGNVYLMECFNDRTVISQIVLNEKDAVENIPPAELESVVGNIPPTESETVWPGATYTVNIPVLNREIEVPEDKYVYWIDGIFVDWKGEIVTLDCAKWMVVTDREYTEEELSRQIRETPKEVALHILYCLQIVEDRDLYPVTLVLTPMYKEKSQGNLSDDGAIERLDPKWIEAGAARTDGYPDDEALQAQIPLEAWNELLFADASSKASLRNYYDPGKYFARQDVMGPAYRYAYTFANDSWWEAYTDALEKLRNAPKSYCYSVEQVSEWIKATEDRNRQAVDSGHSASQMIRAYVDQEKDIHLRAAHYALDVVGYDGDESKVTPLDERGIVFQEWADGSRSYIEFVRAENGSGYSISKADYDYWSAGFEVLREYLAKYYPEFR